MKKRTLLTLVAILLASIMLFTSCGGNSNPTATQDPSATDDASETAEPSATEEPETGMKIGIVDNSNAEKVITEKKFDVPSTFKSGSKFTLSAIYSSNMVLQANMNDRIFGKYSGTEKYIGAQLVNDETKETRVYYGEVTDGEFEIWLGITDYGGPYTLTLFDKDGNSVKFTNILFGEVFVLGGQSNMGWSLGQCYDGTTSKNLYQDIIDSTNNDNVRYMGVWPVSSTEYVEYLDSVHSWESAKKSTVTSWSAVGFFFGMRLNELYGVPVGLVSSCMGGTSIDKWYTEESSGVWYRGMTHPVRKMTVRGVCWYQGEGDYSQYAERLEKLINQWRVAFENENLYWAAVQMPRYINSDAYYQCREEVKSLYGVVDKYTYCVTLDTGLYPEFKATGDTLNDDGIHPYVKKEVGERLADACAHDFYGAEGTFTCPVAVSAEVKDGGILVTFDNVGDGLTLVGLLNGFEIAGKDRKYYRADPELVGTNQVFLKCSEVTSNFYGVRYGRTNYRGDGITSCADSVCCYSTLNGEIAYPLEQFLIKNVK